MTEQLKVETVLFEDAAIVWQAVDQIRTSPYANAERISGAIVLEGEPNKKGKAIGYLVHAEKAMEVEVDLSRLEEGEAILRARRTGAYVLTPEAYHALHRLMSHLQATEPERMLVTLQEELGNSGADRFLELMGLAEPAPDVPPDNNNCPG